MYDCDIPSLSATSFCVSSRRPVSLSLIHISLNFSSMDQITKLWGMDGKYSNEGMPILFNVFNNFYGMGGQTTVSYTHLDVYKRQEYISPMR